MAMSAAALTRTQFLRVRPGDASERPFDKDVCYVLLDTAPYIDYELVGPPMSLAYGAEVTGHLQSVKPDIWKKGDPYWQRWDLGPYISEERRAGRFTLSLNAPRGIELQCYIIPSKLMGVVDVWSMIESVEQELGRAVAWDPDSSVGTRSWIRKVAPKTVSMTLLLLDSVAEELKAARSLRRDPPTELGPRGAHQPVPEYGLVTAWALRRVADLAREATRIDQDLAEYTRRLREHMPANRRGPAEEQRRARETQLARLHELERELLGNIVRDELGTPVVFGSATQRDFRLRRLLRAFSPPASELISETESDWSHLPPLTMNRLFEIWGAVWIVHRLRALGFSGVAIQALGTDVPEGATWDLRRGDVHVALDYEGSPAKLVFDTLPPVDERSENKIEWAIKHQLTDASRSVFGSREACSPDYILRIEGPRGKVMAVGDACLADPEFHKKSDKDKVTTVINYRHSIHWWTDGRVRDCHPLGGFVLFPGPSDRWNAYRAATSDQDIWLFCPEPRRAESSESAAQRFNRFFDLLLAEVL